jgi:ABC-type cobalamin transport system ATPase subunit
MFAYVKKPGMYQYLQIVENLKEREAVTQNVADAVCRMDQLQDKSRSEILAFSLSIFSGSEWQRV